jgi:hypothetical protein
VGTGRPDQWCLTVTTGTPITEVEFDRLLATPKRSAFRLEVRDFYALDYERADFEAFLTGEFHTPDTVGWWRPWLEQIARLTAVGKRIGRVRVLSEPPSDYQRWLMCGDPWHAEAGERILHLPRSRAEQIGLPLDHDWWLLDDEAVIDMRFTDAGEIDHKTLITDPDVIARYLGWRDLAVHNATSARAIAV